MALPIGYQRDADGRFIPPGATVVTYEQNFIFGEALPSGWQTSNSITAVGTPAADTGSVAMDASNDGCYRFGTNPASTAVNDVAALVGPLIHTSRIRAAHFEVVGQYWNDAYVDALAATIRIGLRNVGGANAGGELSQAAADTTAQFRAAGVSGSIDAHYPLRTQGEANKRRHLGFLLIPGTKELAVTESGIDNVVDWTTIPGMSDGLVRPVLAITASEATRKAVRLAKIRLTIWQH